MGYITVGDENSTPVAAYAVVPSWIEDFRDDVADEVNDALTTFLAR